MSTMIFTFAQSSLDMILKIEEYIEDLMRILTVRYYRPDARLA